MNTEQRIQLNDVVYHQKSAEYAAIGRVIEIRASGLRLRDDNGHQWTADPARCWLEERG